MTESVPGFELVFLLLGSFRRMIDDLHAELSTEGFPEARPSHGFALQAIGPGTISISELSRKLGVTKQAASKTVRQLEAHGYVTRTPDPADARASRISRSDRGNELLRESARIFDRQRDDWRAEIGPARFDAVIVALRSLSGDTDITDVGSWLEDA
jgi:DNA-binding MarR family transcriptional regulator